MRSLTNGTEWNKKKLLNHISEIVRTVSFYFFKYFRWKINFITAESLYCFRWGHYNFLSVLVYLGRTTGWCFWSPYQISFEILFEFVLVRICSCVVCSCGSDAPFFWKLTYFSEEIQMPGANIFPCSKSKDSDCVFQPFFYSRILGTSNLTFLVTWNCSMWEPASSYVL